MEKGDGGVVDVSKQEVVNGSVPVASILVKRDRVPPWAVETSVGKSRNFRQHVEQAFPDDVPTQKLLEKHGEQHIRHW